MFIPLAEAILPGEIAFIKIEKNNGDKGDSIPRFKSLMSNTSLSVAGISQQNEVIFLYKNEAYNMSQLFTVNLMTYVLQKKSVKTQELAEELLLSEKKTGKSD